MGMQLPGRSQQEGEDVHINMLKLYVERDKIEETATPGRRDILG